MLTEGPPRYFVPDAADPRDEPLSHVGGPIAYVERTREEADAEPMIWPVVGDDINRGGHQWSTA